MDLSLEPLSVFSILLESENLTVIIIHLSILVLTVILMAVLSNFAVLIEDSHRVMDYTIFTLPRTIEGLWDLLAKKNLVPHLSKGLELFFGISVGAAILLKKKYGDQVTKNHSRIVDFIYGKEL